MASDYNGDSAQGALTQTMLRLVEGHTLLLCTAPNCHLHKRPEEALICACPAAAAALHRELRSPASDAAVCVVQMDLNNLHRLKSLAGLDSALPGSGDWTLGASVLPNPEPAPADPKRQICFDFTKHQCTRGAACKFSHDINLIIEVNSQERGICFDFPRNTCSRGPLCRFSHDLSNFTPQDVQVSQLACCCAGTCLCASSAVQ